MRLASVLCLLLLGLLWAGASVADQDGSLLHQAALALVLPVLVVLALTILGSLLAGALDRSGQRARGWRRWVWWGHESLAFGWCFLIAQPLLSWFMPGSDALRSQRAQLLFVHGFVCNRGLWWRWRQAFRAEGYRTAVIDLPPTWWNIQKQLTRLDSMVQRLRAEAPALPLVLVGHSMGGVAARMLWDRLNDPLLRVVSIGAPHHGTELAGGFGGRRHGPPLPSSDWLIRFNATARSLPENAVNLWSTDDAIVVPAGSSALDESSDHVLGGYGHLGLSQSDEILQWLLRRLRD